MKCLIVVVFLAGCFGDGPVEEAAVVCFERPRVVPDAGLAADGGLAGDAGVQPDAQAELPFAELPGEGPLRLRAVLPGLELRVMGDVAFEGTRGCLTLRPPAHGQTPLPTEEVSLAPLFPSVSTFSTFLPSTTGLPIEVALYRDTDGDGRPGTDGADPVVARSSPLTRLFWLTHLAPLLRFSSQAQVRELMDRYLAPPGQPFVLATPTLIPWRAPPLEAVPPDGCEAQAFGQCRALEQRIEEAGRTWADPAVPPHHQDRPPMAAEPADPLVPSGCARFHGYLIAWQAEDDVPRFYPEGLVDAVTGVATPCVCVTEVRTFFHVFVENGAPEGLVCPEGPPPWSAEEAARRAGLDLGAIERDGLMAGPDE